MDAYVRFEARVGRPFFLLERVGDPCYTDWKSPDYRGFSFMGGAGLEAPCKSGVFFTRGANRGAPPERLRSLPSPRSREPSPRTPRREFPLLPAVTA